MSTTPRPAVRWAVPVGVTALVLGGAVLGPALSASAEVELPERTAAQLLTDLQTARVDAFSGTVAHRADLGLPALPEGMGGDHHDTNLASLLTGEHTLRVWAAGEKARVALHGRLGEYDVVTDGEELWTWSSEERTAVRLTLPDHDGHHRDEAMAHGMPPTTPDAITDYLLGALDPTTTVRSGSNGTVAGRPAYELVLEPKGDSLVESIRIAVDAAERVPTRVRVHAADGGAPALDVGFTSLTFAAPDDDVFAFTPPAGATVEEHSLEGHAGHGPSGDGHGLPPGPDGDATTGPKPGALIGAGWTAVAVGPAPTALEGVDGELAAFLGALPRVDGEWGSGRLLTSRLFSALLTDDGRLLVGAVGPDALGAAALDPRADLG